MAKIIANDISINYLLEGNGKTIVFIHGLSDNLNYWEILSSNLNDSYQILRYDLRAHGDSSDDNENTTIDLYCEDLFCLLKELNIKKAVLIGLSLGGNIALNFTIEHPEMVSGIIIMSSFSQMTPRLEKIFNKFENGINKGFAEFYDTILPYTLTEDTIERNKEKLDSIKSKASKTANIEGIKKGIEAGYSFNIQDKLNAIDVPTLVIAGMEDDLTDLATQKAISDNVKNSELVVLERTKHNILIGRNIEKVLEIIKDFMLKID